MSNPSEILRAALANYMAAFGQALEAHGIPFGPQQQTADQQARRALEGRLSLEPSESMLSWSGHNIRGDEESIRVVKAALHDAGTVPELKQRIKEMQDHPSGAQAGAVQRPVVERLVADLRTLERQGALRSGDADLVAALASVAVSNAIDAALAETQRSSSGARSDDQETGKEST